jgi:excisionase family DNA binding protein
VYPSLVDLPLQPSVPERPPAYYTLLEAAFALRLNPLTLRRWIKSGRLPARKLPGPNGRYLLSRQALDALASNCEVRS